MLGIVGVAAEGLLHPLFIGVALLVVAVIISAVRLRHSGRRPGR
ncbi:hypothetical protein [Kitasatospora sp. NPDC057223]